MTGSPSIALVHNKDNFHLVISHSIPISRAHPTSSPKVLASVVEMNVSITPDGGTIYLGNECKISCWIGGNSLDTANVHRLRGLGDVIPSGGS